MKILADGDSLPAELRAILARRWLDASGKAAREGRSPPFGLVFVAARRPALPAGIELVLVEAGPDSADDRLLELAAPGDLAVTRDLPLAERLAEKGLVVLNDRGDVFTSGNVRERRSLRDRAAELRVAGVVPESPRGRRWGPKELKSFADAFDRELIRALRAG